MSVVETTDFEAFLCWVYLDALNLTDGSVVRGVWHVQVWSMTLSASQEPFRTYSDGRTAELIYHTFNEAMYRQDCATAAFWRTVEVSALIEVLQRAEFQEYHPRVWYRPVRRGPPPGTTTTGEIAGLDLA